MWTNRKILFNSFLFGFILFSQHSFAQLPGGLEVPARIEPGVVGKSLSMPKFQSASSVNIKTPVVAKSTPAKGAAEGITFKLKRVIITGNTVISNAELEKIYRPMLNKVITLADLMELVQMISRKYRNEGYILSRAILPPQKIHNGEVRIKIIEGYISEVSVSGTPKRSRNLIQAYGEHIRESRPLNVKVLERYVLLANDLPGAEVRAVLSPSKTEVGAAQLTLVAKQDDASAYLSYDNYGTEFLGPYQGTFNGQINSTFFPGSSDAIRVVNSNQIRELKFLNYDHTQPLGTNGTSFAFGGSYTDTRPGFTLKPFDIHGMSPIFYTGLSYPIIRSRNRDFFIRGLFNYLNSKSSILGEPLYSDHIRSLEFIAHYDSADTKRGLNDITFHFEKGLQILGASRPGDLLSRANGRSDFNKFELDFSRLQFIGNRVSMLGAAETQFSFDPLLASEEFGFGGPVFGRGYDPFEISGDSGFGTKYEFRVDTHPEKLLMQTLQFYSFYDIGVIYNRGPMNFQIHELSASSMGIGARLYFKRYLYSNLYAAKPLTLPKATDLLKGQNGNRIGYYFQVTFSF